MKLAKDTIYLGIFILFFVVLFNILGVVQNRIYELQPVSVANGETLFEVPQEHNKQYSWDKELDPKKTYKIYIFDFEDFDSSNDQIINVKVVK